MEENKDNRLIDTTYIEINSENILSIVGYNSLKFFFYYDDTSNIIKLIEMKYYKDDSTEDKTEYFLIMDIILRKEEGNIHISYTIYRDNPGSIKNNEELEAFADQVINSYTEECKQWYEKYFKTKEN